MCIFNLHWYEWSIGPLTELELPFDVLALPFLVLSFCTASASAPSSHCFPLPAVLPLPAPRPLPNPFPLPIPLPRFTPFPLPSPRPLPIPHPLPIPRPRAHPSTLVSPLCFFTCGVMVLLTEDLFKFIPSTIASSVYLCPTDSGG